jgi:hypothetical protein
MLLQIIQMISSPVVLLFIAATATATKAIEVAQRSLALVFPVSLQEKTSPNGLYNGLLVVVKGLAFVLGLICAVITSVFASAVLIVGYLGRHILLATLHAIFYILRLYVFFPILSTWMRSMSASLLALAGKVGFESDDANIGDLVLEGVADGGDRAIGAVRPAFVLELMLQAIPLLIVQSM